MFSNTTFISNVKLIAICGCALALLACSSSEGDNNDHKNHDDASAGQNQADAQGSKPVTIDESKLEGIESLQAKLDEKANGGKRDPESERAVAFRKGIELVGESEAMTTALKVGDKAPAFTLPNHKGEMVSSTELLKEGPIVIVWYRGAWCPYCRIQLVEMQAIIDRIQDAGASMVAISPELPYLTVDTMSNAEIKVADLGYSVLSDLNNDAARDFKIVYTMPSVVNEQFLPRLDLAARNGTDNYDMPLAVTYVIAMDGTITFCEFDKDYKVRAEPAEVLRNLLELQAKREG